jgi:hypothetical protein
VAGVQMGLVDHLDVSGRQPLAQQGFDSRATLGGDQHPAT